jgi:hypothetical protein
MTTTNVTHTQVKIRCQTEDFLLQFIAASMLLHPYCWAVLMTGRNQSWKSMVALALFVANNIRNSLLKPYATLYSHNILESQFKRTYL